MILGMHFVNCKADIFKEFGLSGYRIYIELTGKIVDDYFGCLFKINIQGREYIIPFFGLWDLMEIKINEMGTSDYHYSSNESSLAIDWIVFLISINFRCINRFFRVISSFVKWMIMDGEMIIIISSVFSFARWVWRIFISNMDDVTFIHEIVKCEYYSLDEDSR